VGVTGGTGDDAMPRWWTMAIQVLGATAGLIALTTFVGGAMLWLRFDGLDLPADRAVSLLPKELLLVVGAQALVVPIALGLGALLALVVIDPLDKGRVELRFWLLFLPLVFVAMVLMIAETASMDVWVIGIAAAGGVAALGLIVHTARRAKHVRTIAWALFAAFALLGALVNVLEMWKAPRMEPVAVLMGKTDDRKEGDSGIAGFFVGETDERLWFVSLPSNGDPGDPFADAAVDRVVGIPRELLTRIAMREPSGVREDEAGREQAHTMLAELQASVQGESRTVHPVATANPESAFAPLVHLHADDDLLPMSARGFVDNSDLRWSNRESSCEPDDPIAIGTALREAGQPLPAIRDERLGAADPYRHVRCGSTTEYLATDLTRAYHRDGRAPGLPLEQGFYLDLDHAARRGHHELDEDGSQTFLRNVPVYVDRQQDSLTGEERAAVAAAPGQGTAETVVELTYWMLYGLSEPPGPEPAMHAFVHEGDWERVTVRLARLGPAAANRFLPLSARYYYHQHKRSIPWYAVRRVTGGAGDQGPTHPVVYSAEGSHASYWRAGRYEAVYEPAGRRLLAVDDDAIACQACPQWQTWKLVLSARAQLWYGFGGAWGKVEGSPDGTGPLGPSTYKLDLKEQPATLRPGGQAPLPIAPTDIERDAR
jgi:hypothetical protein